MLVKYTKSISKVYTIYEAKTHLSKLGKRAAAGETIYVGAYGNVQFMLAPVTGQTIPKRTLGAMAHLRKPNDGIDTLHLPDPEFDQMIQDSINAPLI